jgi:hypothetical protein
VRESTQWTSSVRTSNRSRHTFQRIAILFGALHNAVSESFDLIDRHFAGEVSQAYALEATECLADSDCLSR